MRLFSVLGLLDDGIRPESSKLHLATPTGTGSPRHLFFAGKFEEWQSWQTRRNFERPHVVALIQLPEAHRWLFAGVYDSLGREQHGALLQYALTERPGPREMKGRLVAGFRRPGRASYLDAERWADQLEVVELLAEPLSIGEFPGYARLHLTQADLALIVRQQLTSWRSALASVGGVYVISDTKSGRLYVGSATGEGGIWSRWSAYAVDGHGGNRELRALLLEHGSDYTAGFQYAILETADTKTSEEEILKRESHWKRVLLTRSHGLNAN